MIALPNFQRAELRTVAVQAQLDMARVAIALERHRLAHGSYPQRLTELAANLPHDLTDTQPLRYRPTVDGHFQLYSLSFNRTDDGGSSATDPKAPGIGTNFDRLDWVWRQPQDPARTARRRAQSQGRNFSSFNCAASCFASAARGPGTLAIFS